MKKWQNDSLYSPHFRQVGFLNAVSGTAPESSKETLRKYLTSILDQPAFRGRLIPCHDTTSIKRHVPALTGSLHGWSGYLNTHAGYVHSTNAMKAVYEDCVRRGVSFRTGSWEGEITQLLFAPGNGRCIGARSRGNKEFFASKVIVALGANIARLIPSIATQVTARCWGVSHVQLSPDEAAKLRGIPVINVRDVGFFFEPDLETNKLKICHMGGGYTNFAESSSKRISLPLSKLADSEFIHEEDEKATRRLLREALPELAGRPLIDAHLCWFADTADSNYIIDYVFGAENSLVALSGDSGHGFKVFPLIGDIVMKLLDEGRQTVPEWRWKDSKRIGVGNVEWRTGSTKELVDVVRAKL